MSSTSQQKLVQGTKTAICPSGLAFSQTFAGMRSSVIEKSRSVLAALLIASLVLFTSADGFAQEGPPPGAQVPHMAPAELDQLVAPIALDPDSLVAQILAASTHGPEVVEADAFVRQRVGMPPQELARAVDAQQWDPSVKALTAFPSVLANLTTNFSWTTRLGEAYYNEPQTVMGAIQAMRQRAYGAGNLRTSPQETVVYQPGYITIMPASPAIVYVPVYNPWVVYGAPVPVYAAYVTPSVPIGTAVAVGFAAGVAVAAFSYYGWGCTHWETNWYSHTVIYNHSAYVARGYYGGYGYRGGYGYHGGYGGGYGYRGGYGGGYGYHGGYAGGYGYRGGSGSGYNGYRSGSGGTSSGYGGSRGGYGYGGGTASGGSYNGGHSGSGTGSGTGSASGSASGSSHGNSGSSAATRERSGSIRGTGSAGAGHHLGHFHLR